MAQSADEVRPKTVYSIDQILGNGNNESSPPSTNNGTFFYTMCMLKYSGGSTISTKTNRKTSLMYSL